MHIMERFQISRRRAKRYGSSLRRQARYHHLCPPSRPAPTPTPLEVKPTRAGNCNHEGASDPAIRALPVILLTTCTHAAKRVRGSKARKQRRVHCSPQGPPEQRDYERHRYFPSSQSLPRYMRHLPRSHPCSEWTPTQPHRERIRAT